MGWRTCGTTSTWRASSWRRRRRHWTVSWEGRRGTPARRWGLPGPTVRHAPVALSEVEGGFALLLRQPRVQLRVGLTRVAVNADDRAVVIVPVIHHGRFRRTRHVEAGAVPVGFAAHLELEGVHLPGRAVGEKHVQRGPVVVMERPAGVAGTADISAAVIELPNQRRIVVDPAILPGRADPLTPVEIARDRVRCDPHKDTADDGKADVNGFEFISPRPGSAQAAEQESETDQREHVAEKAEDQEEHDAPGQRTEVRRGACSPHCLENPAVIPHLVGGGVVALASFGHQWGLQPGCELQLGARHARRLRHGCGPRRCEVDNKVPPGYVVTSLWTRKTERQPSTAPISRRCAGLRLGYPLVTEAVHWGRNEATAVDEGIVALSIHR